MKFLGRIEACSGRFTVGIGPVFGLVLGRDVFGIGVLVIEAFPFFPAADFRLGGFRLDVEAVHVLDDRQDVVEESGFAFGLLHLQGEFL